MIASTLYLFNPDNDLALANNNENYQAPASARLMGEDLSVLPAWWAAGGDKVLVSSIREAELWQEEIAGLLPSVEWYSIRQQPPVAHIRPWGWNPALCKQMRLWGVADEALPTVEAMSRLRMLSSRLSAVKMLPKIRGNWQNACAEFISMLPEADRQGMFPLFESVYCTTEQAVEAAALAHSETILKAPFSSSGKGLRLGHGCYEPVLANWCRRILKGQGGVVVEPFYDKVIDFAMEFLVDSDGVRFVGYSLFRTDVNGAYQGNVLAGNQAIETELSTKMGLGRIGCQMLHQLQSVLLSLLAEWLQGSGYGGYLGIDMMLCRFPGASFLSIHPCVEINLRMNMGVVSRLFYDRYVMLGAEGTFVVDYCGNPVSVRAEHLRLQSEHPLCLQDGRIRSGYLSLVPVTSHSRYRAYVIIDSGKFC